MALYEAPPRRDHAYRAPKPDISLPPIEFQPQISYSYRAQQRVAEYMGNLGPEASPAKRVEAFRNQRNVVAVMFSRLTAQQIDGELDSETRELVSKETTSLTVLGIGIATAYKRDMDPFFEHKLLYRMLGKYKPEYVREIRFHGTPEDKLRGKPANPERQRPHEALAVLRQMDKDAQRYGPQYGYQFRNLPIPRSELDHIVLRTHFHDDRQLLNAVWQQESMGSDLLASERVPNILAEADELLDEFNIYDEKGRFVRQMTETEINAISDPDKIGNIVGEAVDVYIGQGGFLAAKEIQFSEAFDEVMNIAEIRYKKAKKYLKRAGDDERARDRIMRFLHDVDVRFKEGKKPPVSPLRSIPVYVSPSLNT